MHDKMEVVRATIEALSHTEAGARRAELRRLVTKYGKHKASNVLSALSIDSRYGKEVTSFANLVGLLPWQSLAAILVPDLYENYTSRDYGCDWLPVISAINDSSTAWESSTGPIFGSTTDTYSLSRGNVQDILNNIIDSTAKTEENAVMSDLNKYDLGCLIDAIIVVMNDTGVVCNVSNLTGIINTVHDKGLLDGDRHSAACALVAAMNATNNINFGRPADTELTEGAKEAASIIFAALGYSSNATTQTNGAAMNSTQALSTLKNLPINPGLKPALDALFGQVVGGMKFDDFLSHVGVVVTELEQSASKIQRVEELQRQVDALTKAASMAPIAAQPKTYTAHGAIPNCTIEWKKATEIFTEPAKSPVGSKLLAFDVPVFSWDADNPYVPALDHSYEFELAHLVAVLMSVVYGKPLWVTGPTGSGKSSLIQQVAARLGYMVNRVNFDAEMTRLDFIGRDTLVSDGNGVTVSKFVDGALPKAMQLPCIMLLDEIDFIRPDVAAVLMPVAEMDGTPLVITEDGGRVVQPDPMFRIFATSNTKGTGDDTRVYQGTRPQSMALRNRFTGGFIEVDYLKHDQEVKMLKNKVPGLDAKVVDVLVRAAGEIRRAFVQGDIMETCSPRDLFAVAQSYLRFNALMNDHKVSLKSALELNLFNRASGSEKQAIQELVQRIVT